MCRGHRIVVFIIYFFTLIFLYVLGIIYIEIMQENTSRNSFTQKCHCFESLNAGKYSMQSFMKHDFISTYYILPYCDLICLETWCLKFFVVGGDLEEEFCVPLTLVWPQKCLEATWKLVENFTLLWTTEVGISNNFGLYILPYCKFGALMTSVWP